MPDWLKYLFATTAAYLIGAIPVGLVVVWVMTGRDVRTVGSGRTGGTNAMRAAGVLAGVITGLGDLAKGYVSVAIARLIMPDTPVLEAMCAVAAVVGHNWPVYIGFRGGAGTSPNVGAAIAFWPLSSLVLVPLVPLSLLITGYASVTSTVVSVAIVVIFALRVVVGGQPPTQLIYALVTLTLVALALLPNYRRLLNGTERMVGPRARMARPLQLGKSEE